MVEQPVEEQQMVVYEQPVVEQQVVVYETPGSDAPRTWRDRMARIQILEDELSPERDRVRRFYEAQVVRMVGSIRCFCHYNGMGYEEEVR